LEKLFLQGTTIKIQIILKIKKVEAQILTKIKSGWLAKL